MRTLSNSLTALQKGASQKPYNPVVIHDKRAGVERLVFTRLYAGTEVQHYHSLCIANDGSLIRTRLSKDEPVVDAWHIYRQRVVNPDENSIYSTWTDTTLYSDNNQMALVTGLSNDIWLFFIDSTPLTEELKYQKSTDNGATWGAATLIGACPGNVIYALAAAIQPNGDIFVLYAYSTENNSIYYHIYTASTATWSARANWLTAFDIVTGIAVIWDATASKWAIIITGRNPAPNGDYYIYQVTFDGTTWGTLTQVFFRDRDERIYWWQPYIIKLDAYHLSFLEGYNVSTAPDNYRRIFLTSFHPDASITDVAWKEPVPFDLTIDVTLEEIGFALAYTSSYIWATTPFGVWRAPRNSSLDVTADVRSISERMSPNSGSLTIELNNDAGKYSSPGRGDIAALRLGSEVRYEIGYNAESSSPNHYWITGLEHESSPGQATLTIHAQDGWELLRTTISRGERRYNKEGATDKNVKELIEKVCYRAGLKLSVISNSSLLTSFYPDTTILIGLDMGTAVQRLLGYVSDVVFMAGRTAKLLNPLAADASVYSYGSAHVVLRARYLDAVAPMNWINIYSIDSADDRISVHRIDYTQIELWPHLLIGYDLNADTVAKLQSRGDAHLADARLLGASGAILIPPNCGQELYDTIDVTDTRIGWSATKRRVVGIALQRKSGVYIQQLALGEV